MRIKKLYMLFGLSAGICLTGCLGNDIDNDSQNSRPATTVHTTTREAVVEYTEIIEEPVYDITTLEETTTTTELMTEEQPETTTTEEIVEDKTNDITDLYNTINADFSSVVTSGGSYSVKVKALYNDTEFDCGDQSRPMVSASLIKLYVAGAVYENYENVKMSQSHEGEVEELISNMISLSDNDSCNRLVEMLGNGDAASGMEKVNIFCVAHAFSDTQMNRLMLDFNGLENYTSVNDCCRFLTIIYNGEMIGSENILRYMQAQNTRTKIPAGITDGTLIANKTGELGNVENDVAIVYADGGTYIICVMCNGLSDTTQARSAIANAAADIHEYMKQ